LSRESIKEHGANEKIKQQEHWSPETSRLPKTGIGLNRHFALKSLVAHAAQDFFFIAIPCLMTANG